jgi:hypothetical protein
MARFNVPCNGGDSGDHNIPKVRDTITFGTSGSCTFVGFDFVGTGNPYYPPGFSNKQMASDGSTVSYNYDGTTTIPAAGYAFAYVTTGRARGDGTGTIKNT